MLSELTAYSQMGKAVCRLVQLLADPREFVKKVVNRARRAPSLFFIDKETKRFIRHNKKVWKDWVNQRSDAIILVDFYSISETIISYSYFLNILAKKHNATIKSFSPVMRMRALRKVYQSFNTTVHVVTWLNEDQRRRKVTLSQEVMPRLQTKQDVFDLEILGVGIGIDIYETYLKDGKPTVILNDPKLFELVEEAIGLVIFWQDFFAENKVAAVVVSHDCYINLGILCKVAYQKRVPVYAPTIRSIAFLDRPLQPRLFFREYRQIFRSLSAEEQVRAIAIAERQLERRLSGEVGVDMPYAIKSAFHNSYNEKAVLRKHDRIKVLICTHCFFDNPFAYGEILFVDFYEWLHYLGKLSEKTDYDWYIKMHPDPLPGTEEIIRSILKQFPRITFIPLETSHHQLAKEGINFVLTVYGTVGQEYPALGVQVINAGDNPRMAYDFNWHPKTREEYEDYLMNLDTLHREMRMDEVYESYYMHYYYTCADNLFLESYKQCTEDLNSKQRNGPAVYEYFVNQLTEDKHQEIIANICNYLDSGKRFYFSHGPVSDIAGWPLPCESVG